MKERYHQLSDDLQNKIIEDRKNHVENPYAFKNENYNRRDMSHGKPKLWRPAFVIDIERIMHIPYYNRYSDKTQVFSLYKNDDISRRAIHVQYVSRIARNIGSMLGLNQELIEAISLGHDIGHTPFGHAGERKLDEIYFGNTGKHFNHNIHSARVLDKIFPLNLTLETLDGIICHNGEIELEKYQPHEYHEFKILDEKIEKCYSDEIENKKLVPATLEACVMRVSDIIAYLGKDRQDAVKLGILNDNSAFNGGIIGRSNAEIINNMVVDIIENSYGKNYIKMSKDVFDTFSSAKNENYKLIYGCPQIEEVYMKQINPIFEKVYDELLKQIKKGHKDSVIFRHHIDYIREMTQYYHRSEPYFTGENEDDIVVDYIASMTDDYLIDLYNYLFPKGTYKVEYLGYFN